MDTPAVARVLALLDRFLSPDRDPGRAGTVVAVTGPRGSGRSTLSTRIVERAASGPGGPARAVRVPGDVPDGLVYREFVESLTVDDVAGCVAECQRQVIGPMIASPELRDRVLRMLDTGTLPPGRRDEFLAGLGLSPTLVLDRLRRTLTEVVGDPDTALAFSLLLRDDLRVSAWDWLRGGPPDTPARERGLVTPLDTALERTAAFVRLYRRAGRRIVVVFDDADAGLLADVPARGPSPVFRGLQELSWSGAGVFLLGAEGAFAAPELSRIVDLRVQLTPLDRDQVEELARRVTADGEPFGSGVPGDVFALTRGNPRTVSRLLSRLVRRAAGREEVTRDVVRDEAASLFAADDRVRMAGIVHEVLEENLIRYRPDHLATVDPAGRVDFWIPARDDRACAVIQIVDTVAGDADVDRLVRTAEELARNYDPFQGLVVIGGGRSATRDEPPLAHLRRLEYAFRRKPLFYSAMRFPEDVRAEVKSMLSALDEDRDPSDVGVVARDLRRLHEGQARALAGLAELQETVAGLEAGLSLEARRRAERSDRSAEDDDDIPADLRELFGDVLAKLDGVASADAVVRRSLFADRTFPADESRLATDPSVQSVGWAALVGSVIRQFRTEIAVWFGRRDARDDRAGTDALYRICDRYDSALSFLPGAGGAPLSGLDGLPFSARPERPGAIRDTEHAVWSLGGRVRSLVAGRPPA